MSHLFCAPFSCFLVFSVLSLPLQDIFYVSLITFIWAWAGYLFYRSQRLLITMPPLIQCFPASPWGEKFVCSQLSRLASGWMWKSWLERHWQPRPYHRWSAAAERPENSTLSGMDGSEGVQCRAVHYSVQQDRALHNSAEHFSAVQLRDGVVIHS